MPSRLECCRPRVFGGSLRHETRCRSHPSQPVSETERVLLRTSFVPHDHTTHVAGCFRCDLSRDEVVIDGKPYSPATNAQELHSLRVLFDGEGYLDGDEADYDQGGTA